MAYDLRQRVYQLMVNDPDLANMLDPDDIYQRSGMLEETPPKGRPFIVYFFGLENPENLSGENSGPTRRYVHVWVHDDFGDYVRIDFILDRVKEVFEAAGVDGPFLELRFLDRSQDLTDQELHTIARYSRFQATITE